MLGGEIILVCVSPTAFHCQYSPLPNARPASLLPQKGGLALRLGWAVEGSKARQQAKRDRETRLHHCKEARRVVSFLPVPDTSLAVPLVPPPKEARHYAEQRREPSLHSVARRFPNKESPFSGRHIIVHTHQGGKGINIYQSSVPHFSILFFFLFCSLHLFIPASRLGFILLPKHRSGSHLSQLFLIDLEKKQKEENPQNLESKPKKDSRTKQKEKKRKETTISRLKKANSLQIICGS